jgi:two-component system phosphate regulon sensor histidine kinase PhoR
MLRSIRWRIAVPYVVLVLLVMLGLDAYLSSIIRESYLDRLDAQLTDAARLIIDAVTPAMENNTGKGSIDNSAHYYASLLDMRVTVIAPDGTVLGESEEPSVQLDNHLTRPEIAQALAKGKGSSIRLSNTLNIQMYYLAVLVKPGQQTLGIVRVALPIQQVDASISHLQGIIMGASAVAAVLTILMAALIAVRIAIPLRELTQTVNNMSLNSLKGQRLTSALIPRHTDEVGQLTEAFNNLAVQLQSQIDDLEAERNKLAAVLHEMTDGVLIIDPKGKVQMLNAAAENMFGIHLEAAVGHSVAETIRYYQIVDLWQRCQETGEAQSTILEIIDKKLYLQGVATPLGRSHSGSILLLFQNLTRLRQLETVRRDFISNISHELRTPLASLKALTETLQDGALDDPPAARRFLERIETEVDSMSLMVAELLELSRIESGRVPLKLESTRPFDILNSAVERLRMQAERAGLILTLDCAQDLPLVLADLPRMEQVTVNLLHNAIKFTPSGGHIEVSAQGQNDHVVFSVKDNGIGIPSSDLPRIFERFYKADRGRATGGTGLGLSISRHLVDAHGGKIWVESVEGKGSSFYYSIPAAR